MKLSLRLRQLSLLTVLYYANVHKYTLVTGRTTFLNWARIYRWVSWEERWRISFSSVVHTGCVNWCSHIKIHPIHWWDSRLS